MRRDLVRHRVVVAGSSLGVGVCGSVGSQSQGGEGFRVAGVAGVGLISKKWVQLL